MASIYIKPIGGEGEFNCSFHVTDGEKEVGAGSWMVGDEVSILFDVSEEIHRAVDLLGPSRIRSYGTPMGNAPYSVHMKFKVVKRSHGATWKATGKLLSLGSSIWLEAANRQWEEVFRWVCLGEVPRWGEPDLEE